MVVQEGRDNIFQICEIHQNFHEMFGGPLYPKRKTGYNTGINPWEALLEWRPHRNCFVFWTKAPPAITPRPMCARHSRRPEPWSCENQSRGGWSGEHYMLWFGAIRPSWPSGCRRGSRGAFCWRRPMTIRLRSSSGKTRRCALPAIRCASAWSRMAAVFGGAGWTVRCPWRAG